MAWENCYHSPSWPIDYNDLRVNPPGASPGHTDCRRVGGEKCKSKHMHAQPTNTG